MIIILIIITFIGLIIAWRALHSRWLSIEIKRQLEKEAQEKYQDWRELISEANGQLLQQIDLTPLRETNPKLYQQVKKNEKIIMEKIIAQRNKHKEKFINNVMKLKWENHSSK